MHTTTHPTIAGTMSLLIALPHLAPAADIDVSGAAVVTSRISSAPARVFGDVEAEDLFQDWSRSSEYDSIELSSAAQFEAVISFAEALVERIYDLPSDFAAALSAHLPELL